MLETNTWIFVSHRGTSRATRATHGAGAESDIAGLMHVRSTSDASASRVRGSNASPTARGRRCGDKPLEESRLGVVLKFAVAAVLNVEPESLQESEHAREAQRGVTRDPPLPSGDLAESGLRQTERQGLPAGSDSERLEKPAPENLARSNGGVRGQHRGRPSILVSRVSQEPAGRPRRPRKKRWCARWDLNPHALAGTGT